MSAPPRFASWLIGMSLPNVDGDAIAGDLSEEFTEYIVPTRGVMFARWWYRWQVARSLAPLFFRSWQRASVRRAGTAMISAAAVATMPATALLMLRSFVLQQVPLKTTSELSFGFTTVLAVVIVLALTFGCAAGIRLLQPRKSD